MQVSPPVRVYSEGKYRQASGKALTDDRQSSFLLAMKVKKMLSFVSSVKEFVHEPVLNMMSIKENNLCFCSL